MRAHRLFVDDGNGNQFVAAHDTNGTVLKFQYMDTPSKVEPANLVGLKFLLRFPLIMTPELFHLSGLWAFL